MNVTSRIVVAMLVLVCFSAIASAQVRQTKLYIDDGSGHFTVLTGASGGDTLVFPSGGGTLMTTGGILTVSTETDTAKSANPGLAISGKTSAATVVKNGSTGLVTATVTTGTTGQVLYLFNNLVGGQSLTLSGYSIPFGDIGIFIYLSGAWRPLPPNSIG